jgi:hypothetical protein
MSSRFTHPSLGFSIELPPGAEVFDEAPGIALVAAEPAGEAGDGFRANIVVTAEDVVTPGLGPEAFVDAGLAVQAAELVDFRVIDREPVTLAGGRPAARILGHHDVGGEAVTIEQWCVVDGAIGYTVTASCWTLDYDAVADAFAASAESFTP